MPTIIENTLVDHELNISELTEASLSGNGVFDVLLRTLRLHLDREFESNRITGTAYATVYSQAITAFLAQAMQFCMGKSKLALELQQMQEQVNLLKLQQEQVQAETAKIVTDTAIVIKQGHHIDAQVHQTQAQTNAVKADTSMKLPVEVDNLKKQGVMIDTQKEEIRHRIESLLPAQIEQVWEQVRQTKYQTENILPSEKAKLTAEIDLIVTQDALAEFDLSNKQPIQVQILEEQRDQLDYQTSQLMPSEKAKTDAETLIVPKQGALIDAQILKLGKDVLLAEAQLELSEKELLIKEKSIELLEAQVDGQEAQSALYIQKAVTEKAQTDSTVIGTGSIIDRQNLMMQAQADGFKRDAEQKATKILVDTWSLRKNSDPDATEVNATNKLLDSTIGASITKLMDGVGITV